MPWRSEFRRVKAPTPAERELLVHTLSARIVRHLERRGLLVRDQANAFLTFDESDDATLDELHSHSITYRIALGPHAGRKAFTLQTLPSSGEFEHGAARANGFSLHAGVVAASDERDKLERLSRYSTRSAVSTERLSLTAQGLIHYRLKTPYRDGTTQVVFEPLDFMARLAALVPNPRVNLTRYHGVFAPDHHLRQQVMPARRGRRHATRAATTATARLNGVGRRRIRRHGS